MNDEAGSTGPPERASAIRLLQSTVGNQALQDRADPGSVPTRLAVSHPSDSAERDAERIAAAVTTNPDTERADSISNRSAAQRERDAPPSTRRQLDTRHGGRPQSAVIRSVMEPRFGADFSTVTIHDDATADALNRSLNATAVTYRSDIYFGAGQYRPDTARGLQLLAHELAHVLQHRRGVSRDTINRSPANEDTTEQPPGGLSDETIGNILNAVIAILQEYRGKQLGGETVVIDLPGRPRTAHPDQHPDVPSQYRAALWDFYKAAQGLEMQGGHWVAARGERRRMWGVKGLERIMPLLKYSRAAYTDEYNQYLDDNLLRPLIRVFETASTETARQAVEAAGERSRQLLGPERAVMEERIKSTVDEAIATTNNLVGLVTKVRGDRVDDAFQDIIGDHPPPGVFAQRLRGVKTDVALGAVGNILSSIQSIMQLTDAEKRRAMFNRRLGPWGFAAGSGELAQVIGTITQGAVTSLSLIAAATARIAGYADEAAKLIAASGKVTGYLGKALGVLTATNGLINLADPESTFGERLSGVSDVAMGIGSVVGGAIGAGITGGALALKVDMAIVEQGVGASRGLIWLGLSHCYQRMIRDGREIATYGNQVLAGQQLVSRETDAERKSYLERAVSEAEARLRREIRSLLQDATHGRRHEDPGTWGPLKRRFASVGSPPDRDTSRARLLEQARLILQVIRDAVINRDSVLNDSTREAWEQYG